MATVNEAFAGNPTAADIPLCSGEELVRVRGLDLHTFKKCPQRWHLLQVASLAGHLICGFLGNPQK